MVKKIIKKLKMCFVRMRLKSLVQCGKGTYFGSKVKIGPGEVAIGSHSFIGPESWLQSKATLGNYVMLAGRVAIVGGDHKIDVLGTPMIYSGRDENKKVVIEDDVWIGYGVIIMHGVRIGEGAVVAAGAVVTKDVAAYTIVAGIPAKKIRDRFNESERTVHRKAIAELRKKCYFENVILFGEEYE